MAVRLNYRFSVQADRADRLMEPSRLFWTSAISAYAAIASPRQKTQ